MQEFPVPQLLRMPLQVGARVQPVNRPARGFDNNVLLQKLKVTV